jgi:hypothetical protein
MLVIGYDSLGEGSAHRMMSFKQQRTIRNRNQPLSNVFNCLPATSAPQAERNKKLGPTFKFDGAATYGGLTETDGRREGGTAPASPQQIDLPSVGFDLSGIIKQTFFDRTKSNPPWGPCSYINQPDSSAYTQVCASYQQTKQNFTSEILFIYARITNRI